MGCSPITRKRENFIVVTSKPSKKKCSLKTENKENLGIRRSQTKNLKIKENDLEIKELIENKEIKTEENNGKISNTMGDVNDDKGKDKEKDNTEKIMNVKIITDENPFIRYEKISLLGRGNVSEVYKVYNKDNGKYRAMKIIDKLSPKYKPNLYNQIIKEISVLNSLDHFNILKNFEVYDAQNNLYIINQLCSPIELFEKLQGDKIFSELKTANIMKQIISAINFCRLKGIAHRDLRLEKILIDSQDDISNEIFNIKILNFINCEYFEKNKLTELIGMPYYIAPEVLKGSYTEKCDMWSCGVIMYTLLCGIPPFFSENDDEVIELVKIGKFNNNPHEMKNVSKEAKDLIKSLIKIDVDKRLSSEEALNHPWFKIMTEKIHGLNKSSNTKIQQIIENIKNFCPKKSLLYTFAYLIFNFSNKNETNELRIIFNEFDTDNDGRLNKKDFALGLSKVIPIGDAEKEVNRIFNYIDADNGGYIEFQEFLMATFDTKNILSSDNLRMCFKSFDIDNNGEIDIKEIEESLGKKLDINDWNDLLEIIKPSKYGSLNFDEFVKVMKLLLRND